ncbi:MAG: DUF1622 domain-containing protein [Clostridia bacterium]|nr:DUF1622 domain-containing protein [Clostridia bacterium]
MDHVLHTLESVVKYLAETGVTLVEITGILVLLITAAKSIVGYFKNDPHVRLNLAEGIALALEFKLGGEVLHTVVAREWSELAILGAVIVLRAALTVLLHWEIKNEKSDAHDRLELAAKVHEASKKYHISFKGRHANISGEK